MLGLNIAGNSEVKNKDLAKTAIGMVSIDYKKRFEAEYEPFMGYDKN